MTSTEVMHAKRDQQITVDTIHNLENWAEDLKQSQFSGVHYARAPKGAMSYTAANLSTSSGSSGAFTVNG